MLPNLIIIGAAKCGTTSLHSYLAEHPDISMSRTKELNLFIQDDWRDRLDWYSSQFAPNKVRGESSPTYTQYPHLPSTAERIHELLPDAKLIYLVRDPVERTIANYVERVHLRHEFQAIGSALADPTRAAHPDVCPSRYGSQLERFTRYFPRDRVLVIDQGALFQDRRRTLKRVFTFLDVDPNFESTKFDRVHNTGETKVQYNRFGFWLVRHGILTQRSGVFRHGPLLPPMRHLLSKPIDRTLPGEVRAGLITELKQEVARLEELTGEHYAWPSTNA